MGEEAVKMQEEPKVEEAKEEEPKPCPPPPPPPPAPFVLFVDLHCTGCAKKIEKSLMRIRGVEGVCIDMAKNEVTIKGIVNPEAICAKITKKTKRVAKVLSPLPPAEGQPIPQLLNSQVTGLTVVELNVNMHCEACAQQLKRKILKMRGVQTASTELSTGKVVVTGTMDENKLVDYVYRRTKKQARIVPQPQPPQQENTPPPKPEEKKEDEAAAAAPAPPPAAAAAAETKTELDPNNNKEEEQPKPASTTTGTAEEGEPASVEVEEAKPAAEGGDERMEEDHENMKRMMYQYYQYQPLYVIERIPPPQLFSDENPNACCIL